VGDGVYCYTYSQAFLLAALIFGEPLVYILNMPSNSPHFKDSYPFFFFSDLFWGSYGFFKIFMFSGNLRKTVPKIDFMCKKHAVCFSSATSSSPKFSEDAGKCRKTSKFSSPKSSASPLPSLTPSVAVNAAQQQQCSPTSLFTTNNDRREFNLALSSVPPTSSSPATLHPP
jgi:hypothetical protein